MVEGARVPFERVLQLRAPGSASAAAVVATGPQRAVVHKAWGAHPLLWLALLHGCCCCYAAPRLLPVLLLLLLPLRVR